VRVEGVDGGERGIQGFLVVVVVVVVVVAVVVVVVVVVRRITSLLWAL